MRILRWFLRRLWLAALFVALALTAGSTIGRIRHVEFVSSISGQLAAPPAADPASPTGYALGRRMLVLPETGDDSYQWIMQTQAMLSGGDWRIRHVDYDNVPAGREVHWASPLRWWLAGLAWFHHALTGCPIGSAVEWAALRANPLLLGLLLLGIVPLAARRFGTASASFLALALAIVFPFNVFFAADCLDHHGLQNACGMLTVLFLFAGGGGFVGGGNPAAPVSPTRPCPPESLSDPDSAFRWFAASAVVGGVGMWISAATEIPVLAGVGLGAVYSIWRAGTPAKGERWRIEPRLWRWWGIAGAATSVAAYLIEYFPSHLGFRLEVNHPLYALAWLGAGELLCRWGRIRGQQGPGFSRREMLPSLLAAAAVALPPAVILLTKERTFLVADRYVWLLNTEHIEEGKSLARFLAVNGTNLFVLVNYLPVLFVGPAIWLLCGRGDKLRKARISLVLAPTLLLLLLTVKEIRWWGAEAGLAIAAVAAVFAEPGRENRPGARRMFWSVAAIWELLLLPGAVYLGQMTFHKPQLSPTDYRRLEERDIAHWLRLRAGQDPVIVASTPATTNHLIYHGGCRGLGTLYWENIAGLRNAASIFASRSPATARETIRRLGVTHVVLLSWDDFGDVFSQLEWESPSALEAPRDTFMRFLTHGGVPPWLRLVPFRVPQSAGLQEQVVLVFEVVPDQTPPEADAHLLNYMLEMGQPSAAAAVARRLEQYPLDLRAQVTLAYLRGQTGQSSVFAEVVNNVFGDLAQTEELDPGDRVRLCLVLAVAQQRDLAQARLRDLMARLDDRALRRLTPIELLDLQRVAAVLGVEFPDPRLRQLARDLCPPMLRGPAPTGSPR